LCHTIIISSAMLSVYRGAVAGFINVESFFVQKSGSYVGKRKKNTVNRT
jgi:hypothetical protein